MRSFATILLAFVLHAAIAQNGNNANGNPNAGGNNGNGNGNSGNFITLQVTGPSTFNTASFSENASFSKNLLVNGKIGIGVASPTEALDVLGNFRLQGNLFAQQLNVQSLTSTSGTFNTFNVTGTSNFYSATFSENSSFSKNVFVSGKIGIGTSSPAEPLHVTGNIRSNATLFSTALVTESASLNSLTVSDNGIFNGKIGIGISAPTQALDINGNVKATGTLFSGAINSGSATLTNLSLSENAVFNGNVGIGTSSPEQKLHIAGNTKVDETLTAGTIATTTFQTNALSAATATFSNNATFQQDLTIAGKVGIGTTQPTESLDVNGNLKLTGNVQASSVSSQQGNFNTSLTAGNTSINGTLNVTGAFTASSISLENISTSNNVDIGNDLSVAGSTTLTGPLSAQGTVNLAGVIINGQTQAEEVTASTISTTGNTTVGQNLNVTGKAEVSGNVVLKGDLQVDGTFNAGALNVSQINNNGSIVVSQNLEVTGTSQFTGDANFGALHAGIIEATEFRTAGGGSPFNFENARISQTLGIATVNNTVPANYKLAVGGNIIATGIDIKIPQKWPDYVFTDGHKLLTIEEVDAFIKKHGHLPGVLSAEQMKAKENYSVNEMDAKLLEKVEELMLYIIDLKKEIEVLKKNKN